MDSLGSSVVHRLPQHYCLQPDPSGMRIQPQVINEGSKDSGTLVGLKLLSHQGRLAWRIMQGLRQSLTDAQVRATVLEWEEEPCLFLLQQDECIAICCLKNVGVAIAEPVKTHLV